MVHRFILKLLCYPLIKWWKAGDGWNWVGKAIPLRCCLVKVWLGTFWFENGVAKLSRVLQVCNHSFEKIVEQERVVCLMNGSQISVLGCIVAALLIRTRWLNYCTEKAFFFFCILDLCCGACKVRFFTILLKVAFKKKCVYFNLKCLVVTFNRPVMKELFKRFLKAR